MLLCNPQRFLIFASNIHAIASFISASFEMTGGGKETPCYSLRHQCFIRMARWWMDTPLLHHPVALRSISPLLSFRAERSETLQIMYAGSEDEKSLRCDQQVCLRLAFMQPSEISHLRFNHPAIASFMSASFEMTGGRKDTPAIASCTSASFEW